MNAKFITIGILLFTILFSLSSCIRRDKERKREMAAKNKQCAQSPEVSRSYCGVTGSEGNSKIFSAKCATCHHPIKDGTGPALRRAFYDAPSKEWLYNFITNEDSLAAIGDSLTLAIQQKKPTKGEHDQPLTPEEFQELFEYIR